MDKRKRPVMDAINPDTIYNQVMTAINSYCNQYGLDLKNYNQRVNVKHNEVNNILLYCYDNIFKPDKSLFNNQRSLIDYSNIDQLQAVSDCFIRVCSLFNKSLGLYSFSLFSGIDDNTILRWSSDQGRESNPKRWEILKNVKEYNKGALIANLKDTPVGAIAVANNDQETGLNWSKNQQAQVTNNTVYLLPSERSGRLKLDRLED